MEFTKEQLIEAAKRDLDSASRCHEALKGTEYAERVAASVRVFEIAIAALTAEPEAWDIGGAIYRLPMIEGLK